MTAGRVFRLRLQRVLRLSSGRKPALTLVLSMGALLAGCGSTQPPAPAWQADAAGALERYQNAFLSGADRVAQAEFRRARQALAATGEATLVARAELTRCALQVASTVFEPCAGFERLRADVAPAEQAYAQYLSGAPLAMPQVALLPPQHRRIARDDAQATDLGSIQDPVGRLVAAGVLLRAGRASPQVLQIAVDTASRQGWRRPLLAWLGVQAQRAEQAGATEQARGIRRRMALIASPGA